MIYILIIVILFVCELAYFAIADKYNIIDKPNLRSSHTSITLRGGGIIFLIGTWIWAAFFGLQYGWFMAGLTLVGMISFIDDIHPLDNKIRLLGQFAAMMMLFANLGVYNAIGWWMVIPALIVCVGILNAFNFMDGINGITGGYALSVIIPIIYLNQKMQFINMPFLIVTAISLLVFCFFNFRKKAKCFAGDVGSVSIAVIVIFGLGRLIMATKDPVYLLFIAVYGADSILTIVHRIMLHENLGVAHRKHAYQLMANELKIPHVFVSLLYTGLQLAVSFGLILCIRYEWLYFIAVVFLLALIYILFIKSKYYLHEEYLKNQ